jgi:hypothetical protein
MGRPATASAVAAMMEAGMVRAAAIIVLTAMLLGCSPAPTTSSATSDSAAGSTSAAAAEAPPTHNWSYREGNTYGYPAALSDNDKKAGQGATDVAMFKFLGEKDGIYKLSSGGVVASCANPCQVIKVGEGQYAQHMTFDPETVIGEAFTDAFDGQMEIYAPPARRRRAATSSAETHCAHGLDNEGDAYTVCE